MIDFWTPGEVWLDTEGEPIQAHGGGILQANGTYYWYGENKATTTRVVPFIRQGDNEKRYRYRTDVLGVSCYSSTDLRNWRNEGIVLPAVTEDPGHDLYVENVVERPKVVYNESTRQYVMWMHVDTADYQYARAGVAVSDGPTGPFRYLGSERPNRAMSRDLAVFRDDDGRAYLFHAAENNKTLYVAELSDDYLCPTGTYRRALVDRYREAPAVFKYSGGYYMVTSGCTGWDPNAADLARAETPLGPWESLGNPCVGPGADTTFRSQGTFVLPAGDRAATWVFMADRWIKDDLRDSRYVWLPMRWDGERMRIEWRERWDLGAVDG